MVQVLRDNLSNAISPVTVVRQEHYKSFFLVISGICGNSGRARAIFRFALRYSNKVQGYTLLLVKLRTPLID